MCSDLTDVDRGARLCRQRLRGPVFGIDLSDFNLRNAVRSEFY
jgi:hypothetical protein